MDAAPRVSVLVLSWNTLGLTGEALDALARDAGHMERELLVLDNGSEDETWGMLEERASRAEIRAFRSAENLGYAGGNNRVLREARGEYVCLLGSDTRVRPGAIDELVSFLDAHEDYGACAPRLVDICEDAEAEDRVQNACMRFPTKRTALVYDIFWRRWPLLRRWDDRYHYRDFDHLHDADVEQPPGTCLLLRRALFEELGGFDEELWLFFNDVDLCRRIQDRGLKIRYLAKPTVEHHEGASTAAFGARVVIWAQNRIAYYRKHHGRFGAMLVRAMVRVRAWQEWFAIGRRHRIAEHRRSARAELRQVVREALR